MSILPTQAHVLAANLEDRLRTWNERDENHPHPSTTEAGGEIVDLCEEMIQVFQNLRDNTREDLYDYESALRDERKDDVWTSSESA